MHDFKDARLDIIIGTMFSGKTTYLLSEISKLTQLNYKILYINIDFDDRSINYFSTHNPLFDKHFNFNNNVTMFKSKNLLKINILPYDIIMIDEAHFFDDLIEFTNSCLDQQKYIIVAGLQADFAGRKFGKILDLIPICTDIKRLHAYCAECAKDKYCRIAIYSKKIVNSDELTPDLRSACADYNLAVDRHESATLWVDRASEMRQIPDIGGADKYIPVCREHYCDKIINNRTNDDILNSIDEFNKLLEENLELNL
jgi:thymidine kinase